MRIYYRLFTSFALQILKIRFVIHEIVFTEYCCAWSFSEDVETFFPVRISVSCAVGADYLVLEDLLCSFIEAVCESV